MRKFAAHDAKAQFDNLIDTARREPVTIERKRKNQRRGCSAAVDLILLDGARQ